MALNGFDDLSQNMLRFPVDERIIISFGFDIALNMALNGLNDLDRG
jgi:hypothetical protein